MEQYPVTIRLSKLLKNIITLDKNTANVFITGLTLDSRKIQQGYAFCAYKGRQFDGNAFLNAALENQAGAIITDSLATVEAASGKIPIIYIKDLSFHLSEIAANFYDHPSKQMRIIGVTGTNGKTSFCHFLAQALSLLGEPVGVLGTLGNCIYGSHTKSDLTTPNPIELQALLAEMLDRGVRYVAMEVSSHGLEQNRVGAVEFDVAVFTNLTRDHLDFHGDMASYGNAKRKLFLKENLKNAVFNLDDDFGRQLLEEFYLKKNCLGYSAEGRISDYALPTVRAQHVHLNMKGITASLHSPWGDGVLHSTVLGRFNLSNLLAVFTVLGINGFPVAAILDTLSQVQGVNGRMQLFGGGDNPYVVIDFAHTPDALMQVLSTLRDYTDQEVWCVFGCGGNRDQGKRAAMGKISEQYADNIIITDDNPRNEDPIAISNDILQGMAKPERAVVEHNRRRAIAHALNCAKIGDIILVAGKGHENYQIYGNLHQPFSDEIEVQMLLAEKH